MSEDRDIEAIDADALRPWLEGVRSLPELRAELPFLSSDEEAAAFLAQVRRGLADIEAGRLHTTDEVMRELERRRRVRRAAA